jgi:hypothetical protein
VVSHFAKKGPLILPRPLLQLFVLGPAGSKTQIFRVLQLNGGRLGVARTPRTRQNRHEAGLRYLIRATPPVGSPDKEACGLRPLIVVELTKKFDY